jgi:O-antigen ligase
MSLPACRRLEPWHGLALAGLAGPTVALYTPLGMSPLFVLVALLSLAATWRERPWHRVGRPTFLVLAVFLGWAVLSLLWCLDVPQALRTLASLIGLLLGGLAVVGTARMLDARGRRATRLALMAGYGLAVALMGAEVLSFGPGSLKYPQIKVGDLHYTLRMSRGLTVMAVLLGPVLWAAWLSGYRRWALVLGLAAAFAILGGHALSAKLALMIMSPAVLLVWLRRRLGARAVAALAILITLAFPLASLLPPPQESMDRYPFLTNSAHHRLTIWTFTATRAMEKPLFGWGLDAARSVPGAEESVPVVRRSNLPPGAGPNGVAMTEQMLPLHPHSGPGQIWLELGGIGVLLLAILIVVLTEGAARSPRRVEGAVRVGMIIAAFTVSSVSYGIWQSWWLSTLWLAAALVRAVGEDDGVLCVEAIKQGETVPEGSDAVSR